MFTSFVENKHRRKKEPSDDFPSSFELFWIGFLLIFIFSLILLPFGVYWQLSHSIWILFIFFLPLVFLGIHISKSYGNKIFFAVFLSLLAGGNVLLFLGDSMGYNLGLTAKFDVLPEEVHFHLGYRYLYLKEFRLDETDSGSFNSPLLVRRRSGGAVYGPVITFQYKRILSLSGKETKRPLYAICYSKDSGTCQISSLGTGGILLRESIWEKGGTRLKEDSLFIVWKNRIDHESETKGIYSLLFLVFVHLLWGIVVYFPTRSVG
ncbi:hypothetical protein LEP1GSC202_2902 [Leptospira yanagawae serovar Saopaulo str. Sao Paulo = ATCC 700523]|uniref:Uncharacterized protein n=1 Tax=Leptospira yanagawae serovar Saopaulo str. Sao Paulo = ATCC 700523 TaxID=1249483 RepID=A0A5E8H9S1_9LEPT|nr:hypothetical protein [Leptospira yanagawae]EOQ87497.1 hypothetical protein LEP1GSC202_2902 [Leptospira yanagawae serovar Saopaulo str. Sao Paulo = ATCC 700523]